MVEIIAISLYNTLNDERRHQMNRNRVLCSIILLITSLMAWGNDSTIINRYWLNELRKAGPTIQERIWEWDEANASCRGGSGNSQNTWEQCARREKIYRGIERLGWCYGDGTGKQLGYEITWQRCNETVIIDHGKER